MFDGGKQDREKLSWKGFVGDREVVILDQVVYGVFIERWFLSKDWKEVTSEFVGIYILGRGRSKVF